MQSITASIFTSPHMNEKIEGVHNLIHNNHLLASTFFLRADELNLLDFLADPDTGFKNKKHVLIAKSLLEKTEPQWSLFNLPLNKISMLKSRYKFVQSLSEEERETLQDPHAKPDKIAALSLKANTNGVALAFKYYWICKKIAHPFRGMLASTKPVRRALKRIFGQGGEKFVLSDFQHRLAHEVGLEPNRLNSALWYLGQQILEEEQ